MAKRIALDFGVIYFSDRDITTVKVGDLICRCVNDNLDTLSSYTIFICTELILVDIVHEEDILVTYSIVDKVEVSVYR